MKLNERGFTLAGALTIIAVLAIFWALTLPLWTRVKQRDNEEELIFRGNEYVKAIGRYHQKFGTYPPDLETLEKLKYIRKLYPDPMTKSGKWKVLHMDSLVQTGAAGQINVPGQRNRNRNQNNNGGFGSFGDDDEDEELGEDEEEDGGSLLDSNGNEDDEEEPEAEEKEVESLGPVVGVASRSKKVSIKIYNGLERYNKWKFVYSLQQQQQVLPPGSNQNNPNNPNDRSKNRNRSGSQQNPRNTTGGSSFQNNNPPPADDDDD